LVDECGISGIDVDVHIDLLDVAKIVHGEMIGCRLAADQKYKSKNNT
jgi:hypothetical protein